MKGCAIAIALVALTALPAAQAPDRARVESLARKATERMRALQREADALASEERTLLVDLRRLEIERDLKAEELAELDADVRQTTTELTDLNEQVARLETAVAAQRPGIETRLVELYKLGRPGYLRLLLDVDDLRKIGRAYRMVSALARLDRQRIEEHRRTLAALRTTRTAAEERLARAQGLQQEATAARGALERATAARARLIQEIDARRDLNAQLAGELQTAQQRLQATLGAMAAGREATAPMALPLGPFRGDLDWPAAGTLRARFGRERRARFGTEIVRNGIEIATAEGTLVRAVHDGRVAFAGGFAGFGNLVILEHGEQAYSLYGYLASLGVKVGDLVERRTAVGTAGAAPAGPPALYFELRIDGKPVDPLQWLRK